MELHVRRYGERGAPLVILHGLLGSAQNWHTIAQKFAEGFRVLVPDLRNHGHSPHGPHSVAAMRDDLLALMDAEDVEGAFVLGHSMGGLVAMECAFRAPDRLSGLIVEDMAPQTRTESMAWIFEALQNLDLSKVDRREDADALLADAIQEPGVRQFVLQNLKRQPDGGYGWRCNLPELHRYVASGERLELSEQDRYTGPTLFVGGETSDYRLVEKEASLRRHFPELRLEMIPDASHWVHFDQPEAFVRVVGAFLEEFHSKK